MITFMLFVKGEPDLARACAALLPSLVKFFNLTDLYELVVLSPDEEMERVKQTLFFHPGLEPLRWKFTFIEDTYLRNLYHIHKTAGYDNHMLMKLLACEVSGTPVYGVLDSDCYLVQPCAAADLCPGGRCLAQYEPPEYHAAWWESARRLLNYREPFDGPVFGVTPALLVREIVKALITHLKTADMLDGLLSMGGNVTEYTLYWTWILKHGLAKKYYCPPGGRSLYGECAWHASDIEHLPERVERQFSGRREYYFSVLQSNTGAMPPDYLTGRFR